MRSPLIWFGTNAKLLCSGTILGSNGSAIIGNSFATIQCDVGSAVADSISDTLTLTSAETIKISGNSTTDTVSFQVYGVKGSAGEDLFVVSADTSGVPAGNLYITAGSATGDVPGNITITAGTSDTEQGGTITLSPGAGGSGAGTVQFQGAAVFNSNAITGAAFDADSNTLTNVDDGNIKSGADINPNKLYNSRVDISGSNGYGSTLNNRIRRWSTVSVTGADWTYADSSTDGATFTCNTAGTYLIIYQDQFTSGSWLGVSNNSNQLTTVYTSITSTHQLGEAFTSTANVPNVAVVPCVLAVNDVIRFHTNGVAIGSNSFASRARILRLR